MKFGYLILRKILFFKTRCQILMLKYTKFNFGWGSAASALDPTRRAYRDSSFYLYFFARYPLSSLNGTGHMLELVRFENACMKFGYPFPLQIGGPKPPFSTISQLNGKFNGLCPLNETRYRQWVDALVTIRGLLHRLETTWTLIYKWFKIIAEFLPTLRKCCILLHCQAAQTEISKRNSSKLCQTVDSKSH